jgi:hypothetical protein
MTKRTEFQLAFRRTGDWWIDLGLVELYEYVQKPQSLQVLRESDISLQALTEDSPQSINQYSLCGDIEAISQTLLQLKDRMVREDYASYKSGQQGFFLDPLTLEPKLYEKSSFHQHLNKLYKGQIAKPEEYITLDKLSVEQRQALHVFLDAHKELSTADRAKDRIFLGQPSYTLGWEAHLKSGKEPCNFSGDQFFKLIEVKGYIYPLLVDPNKMQSFYSGHKGKYQMGAPYALAALFAPRGLRYVRVGGDYIYFAPRADSLVRLKQIQRGWVPPTLILSDKERIAANFERGQVYTSYLQESLFLYLLAIFKWNRMHGLAAESEKVLPVDPDYANEPYAVEKRREIERHVSVIAFGAGSFTEYTAVDDLFELLDKMLYPKSALTLAEFIHFYRSFYIPHMKDERGKTRPRELLARRMLSRQPFSDVVEAMIFERDSTLPACRSAVNAYTGGLNVMKPDELEMCQKLGEEIGARAANDNNMGSLYDFRNAKTRDQFIAALEQFIVAAPLKIVKHEDLETFIRVFSETANHKEMKSHVVIFAADRYHRAQFRKDKEKGAF